LQSEKPFLCSAVRTAAFPSGAIIEKRQVWEQGTKRDCHHDNNLARNKELC
jgi:hypothetical protein